MFEFLADQRGDRTVVRLADRESGLSARTIARRLSSVSGLYAYLVARGDTPVQVNPVPRGLLTRRQGGSRRSRTAPLVRVPRTLPRILSPGEADRLVGALRTHRDRAMVLAMLLVGCAAARYSGWAGFGPPRSTAYRYLEELIGVLAAARAPGLQEQLERAVAEGVPYLILDGKVVDVDRCREKTTSRKGKTIDLWRAGKTRDFGGNIQAHFSLRDTAVGF